jgi:hypothetical protein
VTILLSLALASISQRATTPGVKHCTGIHAPKQTHIQSMKHLKILHLLPLSSRYLAEILKL